MNCPNCNKFVPENANVCGHCGYRLHTLHSTVPQSERSELPNWIWVVLGAVMTFLLVGAAGFYYLTIASPPPPSTPFPTPILPPTFTLTPSPTPTEIATLVPASIDTQTNRCSIFEKTQYKLVTLDWYSGAPLTMYFKMTGGIPGLEKKIPGDSQPWNYSVQIGDYESDNCQFLEGYKERLYCSIQLPSDYEFSLQKMTLTVSGCNTPIYSNQRTEIPAYVQKGNGGGSVSSSNGSSGPSCGTAPDPSTSEYFDWCACMGGSYIIGFGDGICLIP